MANAKKSAKSSKTAHVLNLLAPGGENETIRPPAVSQAEPLIPAEESPEAGLPPVEAPAVSRPLAPPILEVARSNDEQVSLQIKDALESALLSELEDAPVPAAGPASASVPEAGDVSEAESAPAPAVEEEIVSEPEPAPAPVKESESASEREAETVSVPAPEPIPEPKAEAIPAPVPEPAPEPKVEAAPVPEPEPAPQPKAEAIPAPEPEPAPEPKVETASQPEAKPEPAPAPAPKPASKLPAYDPDEMVVINVMEKLVEEKAPRYIRMFGLCSCPRCAADVKALTLTNLQPAYIVRRRAEAHAMLTVYESRYNSTIFAQLTRACKVVMDSPRHGDDNTYL